MEVYRAIMLTIRSPTSLISYQAMLRLNLFVEDRLARLVYMKDWCGLIEQDLVPKRVKWVWQILKCPLIIRQNFEHSLANSLCYLANFQS